MTSNCWPIQDELSWELDKWKLKRRISPERYSRGSLFDIKWSSTIHTTVPNWPCRLYSCYWNVGSCPISCLDATVLCLKHGKHLWSTDIIICLPLGIQHSLRSEASKYCVPAWSKVWCYALITSSVLMVWWLDVDSHMAMKNSWNFHPLEAFHACLKMDRGCVIHCFLYLSWWFEICCLPVINRLLQHINAS
jgi:hypothetical protein